MSRSLSRNDTTEHRYVKERLSAYLDGKLPPQERNAVERHLAGCRSCQWDLATLRQTVQWTRELPTIPVPRAFTIRAPAQSRRVVRRRWTFVPLLQGATALVALLLFFVVAGDVMLTAVLPSSAPRPAAIQETQVVQELLPPPGPTEAQAVVETVEVQKEVVVVKEVEKAVEEAPMPAEPLPTQAAPPGQPVAATATLPVGATDVLGSRPPPEEGTEAGIGGLEGPLAAPTEAYTATLQFDLTLTQALTSAPAVTMVETGTVAVKIGAMPVTDRVPALQATAEETTATFAVEPMPTTAPAPAPELTVVEVETVAVEVEPTPMALPTAPPSGLQAVASPPAAEPEAFAAPTSIARVEEPARVAPADREQGPAQTLRVPAFAWLRMAEAVLAMTLVLLGTTTVVIMLLQRRGG